MSIYLYVKTHNHTGLKYLGKTTREDYHRYTGSGKYWLRHCEKHGYNYSTEIIKVCKLVEELKFWGLYYTNLWNVVESDEWANLKEEVGDGGSHGVATKNKISKTMCGVPKQPFTETHKKNISKSAIGRVPWNKGLSKETDIRVENNAISRSRSKYSEETKKSFRKPRSEQAKINMSIGQQGKKYPKVPCLCCGYLFASNSIPSHMRKHYNGS